MSDNFESIISQDWDDIAIDDGLINEKYGSYMARLYPREDTPSSMIESKVDSISYSPEVNAAIPMTLDVEPRPELEGQDFLSGIVDVFVDGEPLFSGEIVRIETNEKTDDFYSVKTKPPGQKLNESTIDITTKDFIVSDFMAKIIDKHNNFDDEHFNLLDTSSENLSDITTDRRVRIGNSDNASAEYTDVGPEADGVLIYSKLKTPDETSEITVTVNSPGGSDSITFSGLTEGTRGTWLSFEPENVSGSYDIVFDLETDCILYDWTAVSNPELTRDVDAVVSEPSLSNETIYNVKNFKEENETEIGENEPIEITEDYVRLYQSSFTGEVEDGNLIQDSIWSGGEAQLYDAPAGFFSFDFFVPYPIPIERAVIAFRGSNDSTIRGDIEFDGEVIYQDTTPVSGNTGWRYWDLENRLNAEPDAISGFHTISFDVNAGGLDGGETGLIIDLVNFHDSGYYSDFDFDNTVDENGYLENPKDYPDIFTDITLPTVSSGENILSATATVDEITENQVSRLALSVNDGQDYTGFADTNSVTVEPQSITGSAKAQFSLEPSSPNGRREATPSLGYDSQEVRDVEITVDTEDINLIFSTNFSGNRLEVLSNLADKYNNFFRWEGNQASIFKRGTRKTDVNLRKEDIDSVQDIEDVYDSVEVIGLNGVTSGILEAENAPDYVEKHKEIRDADIETENDAVQRARSFLDENSTIDFEGQINTLPTRAPVGEMIDGSLFAHGQDSVINKVRYSKRSSTIDCTRQKDLRKEILSIDRDVQSSQTRDTR